MWPPVEIRIVWGKVSKINISFFPSCVHGEEGMTESVLLFTVTLHYARVIFLFPDVEKNLPSLLLKWSWLF